MFEDGEDHIDGVSADARDDAVGFMEGESFMEDIGLAIDNGDGATVWIDDTYIMAAFSTDFNEAASTVEHAPSGEDDNVHGGDLISLRGLLKYEEDDNEDDDTDATADDRHEDVGGQGCFGGPYFIDSVVRLLKRERRV